MLLAHTHTTTHPRPNPLTPPLARSHAFNPSSPVDAPSEMPCENGDPRIPRWMPARTTAPFSRSARPSPSLSGALPTRASPTALPSVPCCLAREIALALPCPRTKLVCYLPGFGGRSRCSGIVSTFYVDFSSSDGSLLLWSPIIWDSRPTNSTNQTAPEIHLEHTDTKHYLHTSLRESDSYLNHVLSV